MSNSEQLFNSLTNVIPESLGKLSATKAKTQDIIKYCTKLYIDQDKEGSYSKTEQYVDSVYTNVIYFVTQTSVNIMDMLESQTKEIERVNVDVGSVASKLKQLRTIAGVEEMLKFNTPKPTLRSKKMKKVKMENPYTEKIIEGHINWSIYDKVGVSLADVKTLEMTQSFRSSNTESMEAPVEDDLPPPSLDVDGDSDNGMSHNSGSFNKHQSFMNNRQSESPQYDDSLPPPSLDLPEGGPPSLDIPEPPQDDDDEQEPVMQKPPTPQVKPPTPGVKPPVPVTKTTPPTPVQKVTPPTPVQKVTPPTPQAKPTPTPKPTGPPPKSGGGGGGPPPPPPGPPPGPKAPPSGPPVAKKSAPKPDEGGDLASQLAKKRNLNKVPDEEKKNSEAPKIEESKAPPSGGGGGDLMSQMLAKRNQMKPPVGEDKPQTPQVKPVLPSIPTNKPTVPTPTSKPTVPTPTAKPTVPTPQAKPTGPPPTGGKPGGPPPPPPGPPKAPSGPPKPVTKTAPKKDEGGDLASQLAKKRQLNKVPEEEKKNSEAPKIEESKGSSGGGGGGDLMSQMLAKRNQLKK